MAVLARVEIKTLLAAPARRVEPFVKQASDADAI